MSLRKSINFIARKILYLVIKTEIAPSNIKHLNIDSELPIIYVLDVRSWSNLLVLETECHHLNLPDPLSNIPLQPLSGWHSVYTIAHRQPFKAWLQKQPKRSRMLRGIVETLREYPDQEIQFVPVSIFWGRPVAKQKHWIQILFSDSWGIAGRTRKFFTIIFHGRDTLINFSEPITFISSNHIGHDDAIIDHLQQDFSQRLNGLRTATLGPDVSHRRTLVRELLQHPDVQHAIHRRSKEDNKTTYKTHLQAKRYFYEIVADCTNITIQILQRLLKAFWNKFYSGIEVSYQEDLQNLALTHELVYTPCHRSHIDYLLLSYVIHSEGLAIPYIAAGKNLNMPVIGPILRGAGAFFIRRSFKGNELYSTVMFEYVAKLLSMGMPIEYFIEGGRSRTGRLLKPKPGMLAMTIRAFLKYRNKPVAFIPVYIGYEKMLESKAYQAELSGEDKKSETLMASLRSILRIRGEFGRVYASFGDPVFLNKIIDKQNPLWKSESFDDTSRPPWLIDSVNDVSLMIMQNINRSASINPTNMVATALLSSINHHMDETELIDLIKIYQLLILSVNYSSRIIMTDLSAQEQVLRTEKLRLIRRRRHELGDIIYLDAKHSLSMTYHRNNILHLFAVPSLIACCFLNIKTHTREDIFDLISLVYPFLRAELFLCWNTNDLPSIVDNILHEMTELGLLVKNDQLDVYSRAGSGAPHYNQLMLLSRVISPVLEVYYLVLAVLYQSGQNKMPREELEHNCYLMTQRIALIHELNSPDFSDKHLIFNFIETLINIDYVKIYDTEHIELSEAFTHADRRARLLLSKEMRTNILQIMKIDN